MDFPSHLVESVFAHLSGSHVAQCCLTSKQWNTIGNTENEDLWLELFNKDFGRVEKLVGSKWKDIYAMEWRFRFHEPKIHTIKVHKGSVNCVCLNGDVMVSGSRDCMLKIWDMESFECVCAMDVGGAVLSMQMDDKKVVIGGEFGIKVIDLQTRACVKQKSIGYDYIDCLQFDSEILMIKADDELQILDVETLECRASWEGGLVCRFNELRIVEAGIYHSIIVSNRKSLKKEWSDESETEDAFLALEIDGEKIVGGSSNGLVYVFGMDGELMYQLQQEAGVVSCVLSLQFDGLKLLSACEDGLIRMYDLHTQQCIRVLGGHTAGVRCLQFSPTRIVSSSRDGNIVIWTFS